MIEKIKKCEIPFEIVAALFILILIGVVVSLSNFWHSCVFWKPETIAFYMLKYPKIISDDERKCITVVLDPRNVINRRESPLMVKINDRLIYWENIFFKDKPIMRNICIDGNQLGQGDNFVYLYWYDRKLFFHVKKADKAEEKLKLLDAYWDQNKNKLIFSVESSLTMFEPINIFVNNKLVRRVYPTKHKQTFEEKISLSEFNNGKNEIVLEVGNTAKKIYIDVEKKTFSIVGFLVLGIFLLGLLLQFRSESVIEKLLFSFLAFASTLIVLPFILNYLGLLSPTVLKVLVGLIGLALIVRNRNALTFFTFAEIKENILNLLNSRFPVFAIVLLFHILLFYHLFSVTYFTYWNIFYERQASLIIENNGIPLHDELSYLGRGFTVSLGYPLLEASISWLTGLTEKRLFAIMLVIGNILFILACFYFCSSLKFDIRQSAIFYLLLSFCMFILTGMIVSPRHIISFAFVIAFLGLTFRNINWKYRGILLGINGILQTPMLFFAPLFSLFFGASLKKQIKAFLLGFLIFGVSFLPSLLAYGLPTQAKSANWGYLIKMPVQNFFFESGMLLVFVFLFGILDLVVKRKWLNQLQKQAFIAIAAGVLIQLFLTYRWNIFTSLALGIFVCTAIKPYLEHIYARRLIYVLIFLSAFTSLNIIYGWIAPTYALHGIYFVKQNVSANANILVDPLFGHSLTGIAHKKVLADLCVEYAPQEKLDDTYKFLETADKSILKKYDISVVVNQGDIINKDAMHNKPLNYELDFEFLDKIFDNKFLFVHRYFGD